MNYNSLRYFIEVARTLSFTKASENLFVSQPGISQQIHLLEEQLNVKLLDRTTRKVELTDEGEYLYKKVLPSLSEIENTITYLEESKTFPSLVKLATIPSAASLYLPKILKKLLQLYPEIEFSIKETTSSEVMELLKDKTCHLGFIRPTADFQLSKKDGINYHEFKRSPIKAVVSSEHRLAHKKSINLYELKNDFFLHYDSKHSTALYHLVEDACNNAGFRPNTICTGSELLTISNIISKNLGVTLLPNDMLELVQSDTIRALEIEDVHLESSIVAVWPEDGYVKPNIKLMIEILKELSSPESKVYL